MVTFFQNLIDFELTAFKLKSWSKFIIIKETKDLCVLEIKMPNKKMLTHNTNYYFLNVEKGHTKSKAYSNINYFIYQKTLYKEN